MTMQVEAVLGLHPPRLGARLEHGEAAGVSSMKIGASASRPGRVVRRVQSRGSR